MKKIATFMGNIIPVPGLFDESLVLKKSAYRKFIERKLKDGDRIFYLAHSASEFKYMSTTERLDVVRTVGELCQDEEVLLLAQPVGSGSSISQLEEGKKMIDAGAHALVVLPVKPVMAGKFYSCHYEKAGFKKEVHQDYYLEYLGKFSECTGCPLIFHDAPLANNKGLPFLILNKIISIDNVHGIKVHSSDPCAMQSIYQAFAKTNFCFDGFGKTVQFWSLIWGARARHTCWSWFDSSSDQSFYRAVTEDQLSVATKIVSREWDLANLIRKTGFGGYKEIMRIEGIVDNNKTREPGLHISSEEAELIRSVYEEYKESVRN